MNVQIKALWCRRATCLGLLLLGVVEAGYPQQSPPKAASQSHALTSRRGPVKPPVTVLVHPTVHVETEPVQVYVRNVRVGTAHLQGGVSYVPVVAVARTAGVDCEVTAEGTLRVRGVASKVVAKQFERVWYAGAQELATLLGLSCRIDRDMAMIDFSKASLSARVLRPVNETSPGSPPDLARLVVPGHETLLFLGTAGDPNTTSMEPIVNRVLRERDGLVVYRLEINRPGTPGIDWESPLMHAWGLHACPYFVIYDALGHKVAEGDAAYRTMLDWLRPASTTTFPTTSREARAKLP